MHTTMIVSFDNLGDVVFLSVLTQQLKKAEENTRIIMWLRPDTAPIGKCLPGVDQVVTSGIPKPLDRKWREEANSALKAIVGKVDTVLIASKHWRFMPWIRLNLSSTYVGFGYKKLKPWLTVSVPVPSRQAPVLNGLVSLLGEDTNRHVEPFSYALTPPKETPHLEAIHDTSRWVGLHPFAGSVKRCVPLENWILLAHSIRDMDYFPVWFGTSPELGVLRLEIAKTSNMLSEPANMAFSDQLGDGSLEHSIQLLGKCRLFIGHDSSPMHMAAAQGVPTIGIFAPGEPRRTFPQGPGPWRMVYADTPEGISLQGTQEALKDMLETMPASPNSKI